MSKEVKNIVYADQVTNGMKLDWKKFQNLCKVYKMNVLQMILSITDPMHYQNIL